MQGAKPLAKTFSYHRTSGGGLGSIIGRRKRAVGALASTVPFFGVADRLPRGGLSRGTWNSGLNEVREHMPRKPLDSPPAGTVVRSTNFQRGCGVSPLISKGVNPFLILEESK